MGKVNLYNADRKFVFSKKEHLKMFVKKIFKKEAKMLSSINYVFCSDEYLLKINQDFLQHDYYTDVITFDLSAPQSSDIDAEVYISLDRIIENAKANNTTQKDETLRVIFHAALHLCGYNDKKKSEILKMREKEEYYLLLYRESQSK